MRLLILLFGCFIAVYSSAQNIIIPGNTGYLVPAEKEEDGSFTANGLEHWSDPAQQLQYFIYLRHTGTLNISVNARNAVAGNKLLLTIAGKTMPLTIPAGKNFVKLNAGTITINDTGFYKIAITVVKRTGKTIADIKSLELSGTAVKDLHYNPKPRRNAASVHLKYPLADTVKAIAFYNEITVPEGADIIHSYYMACGFARGYFGIQVNGPSERRVIFSVWDAGNEGVDRSKVPDSNKVQLLAKGEGVYADGFGNEGTGGHSHWVYPWKTGTTYKLMVTALPDSASRTTIYTGYFFIPELQKWKLIASFKAPKDAQYLRNLYSFNENFVGLNGQLARKAFFGNQWIQRENGSWKELTQSSFSYDATGKAGDRIDYGGGVSDGKFYLWNGGFEKPNAVYGQLFERAAANQRPVIDWTKNADSALQAEKDKRMIFQAVAAKQVDTTGSVEGVYYNMLNPGTGNQVSVNDTVTVYYKGSLLKDGSIFDQTKEKPATFPLKRLIKGWQLAVPMIRVGGKIRMFIPSGLAYTIRSRSKDIPPNSVLVFDVEVIRAVGPQAGVGSK